MSFMTWSSKTWEQVKMIVKTWQPQVWNLTFFSQDLVSQVLNCYIFATPCPQVLAMIALFETWLSKSWSLETFCCIDFQPYNEDLCLSWLGLPRHEHNWKWLSGLGSCRSEIVHLFFTTWLNAAFLQLHVPKSWQWLHYSRLGFPSLQTFRGKEFER